MMNQLKTLDSKQLNALVSGVQGEVKKTLGFELNRKQRRAATRKLEKTIGKESSKKKK